MPYLSESILDNRQAVPVSLALTKLQLSDWLVLATLRVLPGMTLTYKFLQLQLADITFPDSSLDPACDCANPAVAIINSSYGAAFVAIYKNYAVNTDPKTLTYVGTTADLVQVSEVGIGQRDYTLSPLVVTEAADYSWILVNNTSNANLLLAVEGQATVDLT